MSIIKEISIADLRVFSKWRDGFTGIVRPSNMVDRSMVKFAHYYEEGDHVSLYIKHVKDFQDKDQDFIDELSLFIHEGDVVSHSEFKARCSKLGEALVGEF